MLGYLNPAVGAVQNAKLLAGHRASVAPTAGDIPVLGPSGTLPASIGAVGPQGPAGPQGQAGAEGDSGPKGSDGKAATSLWAAVNLDGTLKGSAGVVSATRLSTGAYQVTFAQDVSKCAIVAQPNVFSGGIGWDAESAGGTAVRVHVDTISNAVCVDSPFSLAVFCEAVARRARTSIAPSVV